MECQGFRVLQLHWLQLNTVLSPGNERSLKEEVKLKERPLAAQWEGLGESADDLGPC